MDEQLCMLGFGLSLAEKTDKAIATLQHYEPEALRRDPANGYYLCDSYGKDSCVILDLAKRSGVRFVAHHNLTTLDPPELIRFGRKQHPETWVHRPDKPMLSRLAHEKTTLPTRNGRWCCEEYKERAGIDSVRVYGVRAAESARRKAAWKVWHPQVARKDRPSEPIGWVLNPILYWTDEDVWRYMRQEGVPYCSLYDDGFTRLGCVGCPMSNKRQKEFARWPRYETAWRLAIATFWKRLHDAKRKDGKDYYWAKFRSADELWRWWMEEEPAAPDNDECQMGLF